MMTIPQILWILFCFLNILENVSQYPFDMDMPSMMDIDVEC